MLEGGPLMLVVLLALGLAIAVYVTNKRVKANREAISRIKQEKNETTQADKSTAVSSEEEIAAFMALHLYLSQAIHDRESNIITIERIQRRYSPWSSKIYNMNNVLR